MKYSLSLPKEFTVAFLASVYIIGFILSPYWVLQKPTSAIILFGVVTLAVGIIWIRLTAGPLTLQIKPGDQWLFVLVVGMVILNFRALTSVIPFLGDETLHIERTLELVGRIPSASAILVVLLFILFLVAGLRQQKWYLLIGAVIVTCIVLFFWRRNAFDDVENTPIFFLRYPFINYWFFALLPKLASLVSAQYHEFLYRIIPVVSMIGVSWAVQRKTELSQPIVAIAWGVAVATIPTVYYYSSILYLEPPAVLLMTIVCLDIRNLLHLDRRELLRLPAWYALILIGFVKETTIPFLACFLVIRMIVRLQIRSREMAAERSWLDWFADELGVVFAVLAPIILYLCFRTLLDTRSFVAHVSNLLDPAIYPVIARAFLEQFGIFFALFLGGCLLLWKQREYPSAVFFVSAILAVLAFHILDNKDYVGYSRFQLFLIPPILAGSLKLIQWVDNPSRSTNSLLVLVAIGSNVLLSPVHFDGVKTAGWGNYFFDTSEHYYPYQDALVWLKGNAPDKRILFTGLDFYYSFQFYWNKLDWKPRRDGITTGSIGDEQLAILNILQEADRDNYEIVVYRVLNEDLIVPAEMSGFHTVIIANSVHRLIIFHNP